jgi:hypothetical protein
MSSAGAERLIVLALAASAGMHGALVPAHASEAPLLGPLFALSALLLAALTIQVARVPGVVTLGAAALMLAALLAAYIATRSQRCHRSRIPSRSTCSGSPRS